MRHLFYATTLHLRRQCLQVLLKKKLMHFLILIKRVGFIAFTIFSLFYNVLAISTLSSERALHTSIVYRAICLLPCLHNERTESERL